MKFAAEALHDGFKEIPHIVDPIQLATYRKEGVRVDDTSIWRKTLGDIDIDFEPIGEEDHYQLAIYKNRILLADKIPVKLILQP